MSTKENLEKELERLRLEIADCDKKLLTIFKRRLNIASQIGNVKRQTELPIMNTNRENEVLQTNQREGEKLGLPQKTVNEFTQFLFDKSKEIQHNELEESKLSKAIYVGKKCLIVGGCGQIGLWFTRYLQSLNFEIDIFDALNPQKDLLQKNFQFNLLDEIKDHEYEFIFITTPMLETKSTIEKLVNIFKKNQPIIVECCSLKSEFLDTFTKLKNIYPNLTSIHPMFGPSKKFTDFKNMVICEPESTENFKKLKFLFDHPSTQITSISMTEHDKLMGYVLGLSHLSNLVFAQTLSTSGYDFKFLRGVSSTTFQNQIENVIPVAQENQDLYFDIQNSNPHSEEIIRKYQKQLELFLDSIMEKDREQFRSLMGKSKDYLK